MTSKKVVKMGNKNINPYWSDLVRIVNNPSVLMGVFGGIAILLLFYIFWFFRRKQQISQRESQDSTQSQAVTKHHDSKKKDKPKIKKKPIEPKKFKSNDKHVFSSNWLLTTLKGHTGPVLDMDCSSNGKYLASCDEERAVFLWDIKDLNQNEHKSVRVNIEFDYATFVKWSPDSKAFIIHKYNENALEVYKIEKKKSGWLTQGSKVLTFPKGHTTDVIGMGISSNGKFIMTCSNKTDMILWDLKGEQLGQIDTYLMSTTCAKISPCGKFVVASGFAPDVKFWEVMFDRSGEFQKIKRVFELTGHTTGVYDVAFDADSSHVATVSKDGLWKLFDIKIEYTKGEDPHLKITGKYEQMGNFALIALSPNAEVVVIAAANVLSFYSTLTGELDHTIDNVFVGNITSLLFNAEGTLLFVSGDKHIRVFHNVTGYRCTIQTSKEKLKQQNQSSATRDRLQTIIKQSEAFLVSIES